MAFYGRVKYWNERYTKEKEPFEWYQRYSSIRHLLPRSASRVLNLGCGNSLVSEEMLRDGYSHIVNIDYSSVVINQMKERYKDDLERQEFECADVTKSIPYPDETFDLVICKGTLDAVLCSSSATINVKNMMEQCCRVLKDDGSMVIVSYGTPENRMEYVEDVWKGGVEVYTVAKPRVKSQDGKEDKGDHYVYVCKKTKELKSSDDGAESDVNPAEVTTDLEGLKLEENGVKGDEKKDDVDVGNGKGAVHA
mmetsp:Transcript_10922/g.13539  ORF Transcript_10922/g.13539 Transcript_10922/m.13539 type:complete len:251 (-) Transcript_10922:280-1032(-)|eukprot:CAMPEP_0172503150 /NCGR_PEP_ID=MMETSP1066-20121228/166529_1 /TAXON_ID=671091 /ORGANISM="Coscinodiscus wailesii, Strain CCMP2513" /LENGTH=250 /DNA_ID=CAMNT_0013278759 /DNA_START=87 /DNA_END=839 /DNA_ORIENTATION=+